MPDAFSMIVPVAEPYRALAPDVAARYAELAGGSADAAASLASAVTAAIDRMAAGAAVGAEVGLSFTPDASGIRVELSCNGRRESVGVAIPVARR